LMLNLIPDESSISGYADALSDWNAVHPTTPAVKEVQKNWDLINLAKIIESIKFTNEVDDARFLASTAKESGAWMDALPSRSIQLLMDNNTFRISVALRLGCDLCRAHKCFWCDEDVDESGTHGLSCVKSRGRGIRHKDTNKTVSNGLSSADIPNTLEPVGLHLEDCKRVDGITQIPFKEGRLLTWDVTVSDTLAPSYLTHSSKVSGIVAKKAAQRKISKYKEIVDNPNYLFVPLAFETLGPWCEEAIDFVNTVGRMIQAKTGEPRSTSYFKQRISIAIQRGNAISVMGTLGEGEKMDEIFYLL